MGLPHSWACTPDKANQNAHRGQRHEPHLVQWYKRDSSWQEWRA